MVVAADLRHAVADRAARGDPVQYLDALAARELDDVEGTVLGESFRVRADLLKAEAVIILVDETGACTIELMREASSAEDDDLFRSRPTAERLADCASESEAPPRAWQRMGTVLISIGTTVSGQDEESGQNNSKGMAKP
jgi:hypothetical protein